MKKNLSASILVIFQFSLIALIVFTTKALNEFPVGAALILLAVLLMAWAIITMNKSKLRVSPIPANTADLITVGPYEYLRHPMYTAVLLGCVGFLVFHFNWIRLSIFIALTIVLIIKLHWEERMLEQKFKDYQQYKQRTKKIIPFLY